MKLEHWQTMLADTAQAGVYRLPSVDSVPLLEAAAKNGQLIFKVSLTRAENRDDALRVIGNALAFPEWFGYNLDALFDCLVDLGWRPAQGYIVLLERCGNLLAHDETGFGALLGIFADAAEEWRTQGICFWCLADAAPTTVPVLPDTP